jgi:hypothetical protein
MRNILEVEAAHNTFKKESELKSLRIVNKSVFGRLSQSILFYLIVTVWFCYTPWRKRQRFSIPQMLLVNINHVPTVSLPSISYCNFPAYLQNRYIRYNMYSGRSCENSLQRRRIEWRNYLYEK